MNKDNSFFMSGGGDGVSSTFFHHRHSRRLSQKKHYRSILFGYSKIEVNEAKGEKIFWPPLLWGKNFWFSRLN
ncbi:MAG: hypothetical protein DRR42_18820 [Gammaproteobacteria bacterium]|nr:MAG: hypothetical protein DRR42_18820 [Gammaproteobacteria bacterium]